MVMMVSCFFIMDPAIASKSYSPLTFKADLLRWEPCSSFLYGEGEVTLTYQNIKVTADKIEADLNNLEIWAKGNIFLKVEEYEVKGKSLWFSFKKGKGTITLPWGQSGPLIFKAREAQFSSTIITLQEGGFTTCDLPRPHYQIKAKQIQIIPKEKIVARNATLYIGSFPVFWMTTFTKYLLESGKSEHNEIIFPHFGYNDFTGWYVKTGYQFYISPLLRGTFHLDYLNKCGWAKGIDLFHQSGKAEVNLKSYYIKEKDTQKERWQVKLTYEHSFSRSTILKLNLDRVSDEDFLKDYFSKEDGEIPSSFLSLNCQKDDYNINFLLEPEVNPFKYEESIQRLPEITLGFPAQKIKGTGFYLGKGAQIVNFKKENKGLIRADSFLDISYPFAIFKHLQIEPEVGYHLFWYKDKEKKEGYRRIPYQNLTASFEINGGDKEKYTYSLKPSLGYYHSMEYKNDFICPFDLKVYEKKTEDIHPPNLIKLGIKNDLYYKEKPFSLGNLSIGYNLTEEKRGFSSLEGEFHLTPPLPFLNYVDLYFLYDCYNEKYEKIANSLDLEGKNWHLNLGFRKYIDKDTDVDVRELFGEIGLNLGEKWRISSYATYDMEEREIKEIGYSIWRDLHCWAAQLSIKEKPIKDYSITLYIKAFPLFKIASF